jgi:hypothetical protein
LARLDEQQVQVQARSGRHRARAPRDADRPRSIHKSPRGDFLFAQMVDVETIVASL